MQARSCRQYDYFTGITSKGSLIWHLKDQEIHGLCVAGTVSDGAVTEGSSSSNNGSFPDLSSVLGALATFGNSNGGNTPDGPAQLDGAGAAPSYHKETPVRKPSFSSYESPLLPYIATAGSLLLCMSFDSLVLVTKTKAGLFIRQFGCLCADNKCNERSYEWSARRSCGRCGCGRPSDGVASLPRNHRGVGSTGVCATGRRP